MNDQRPARIILVEDNELDARATMAAIARWEVPTTVEVLTDGTSAIEYLMDPQRTGPGHRPDLVLLDVNLPGSDGHEILAAMKGHDELRRVPVIMLTTSSAEPDVVGAYDLGVNAYIVKPVGLQQWSDAIAQIEQFWFSIAQLPPS